MGTAREPRPNDMALALQNTRAGVAVASCAYNAVDRLCLGWTWVIVLVTRILIVLHV